MNRIDILYKAIERSTYFSCNERIDHLFCLAYFLSLREIIKETVFEEYRDCFISAEKITEDFLNYDDVEYENYYIYGEDLKTLILEYAEKCFRKIDSNTLKLEL